MKNALTPSQGTAAVSEPWRQALRTFDQDLQRRGAADRTRKAYGTDAAELRRLGDREPARPGPKSTTRRWGTKSWAARLSQKGAAPRTMARKLASTRIPFRSCCSNTATSAPTRPT